MAVADHVTFEMTSYDFCLFHDFIIKLYVGILCYLKQQERKVIFWCLNFHGDAFLELCFGVITSGDL